MLNDRDLNRIVSGVNPALTDNLQNGIEDSIQKVSEALDAQKANTSSKSIIGNNPNKGNTGYTPTDTQVYTNISDMINIDSKISGDFSNMLETLAAKNKKYFTIIKDYEIMPILIPQINRVLMFLVNECISPDIQNDRSFELKYTGNSDEENIQANIDTIREEMKLDKLLRDVYTNRYKLGRDFYLVVDYNATLDRTLDMIKRKSLNESYDNLSDTDFLDAQIKNLTKTITEATFDIAVDVINEDAKTDSVVTDGKLHITIPDMNIVIERSAAVKYFNDVNSQIITESYSKYSINNIFDCIENGTLNEAITDMSKTEEVVRALKAKKINRCMVERLDPARTFKLKVGGKIIGYMYTTDIIDNNPNVTNFGMALKDQLIKSKVSNIQAAYNNAEKTVSKILAEKIINTFDPNVGINRIEDIDMLHDYIIGSDLYKGNKKITFYYSDEVFDMSRADESILTNAVYATKLYSTLTLNNVITKVLRGRGRQIHTVKMGVSTDVRRYIDNALATLAMPEANLGTLSGSFEQLLNPFNAAADIIIPTDDDSEKYIQTDYIPGQDVDMNDDFLKMLLNSIITSFGLDAAVLDATNGNLQFAKTLTAESLQICNSIRMEQNELIEPWKQMCLKVLEVMGNDSTKQAVKHGKIKVKFFAPKSLILQNTIDDLNNSKAYADSLADIIPEFNEEGADHKRAQFIYNVVKERTNVDWEAVNASIKEASINLIKGTLDADIRKKAADYKNNTEQHVYGDDNGNDIPDDEDPAADKGTDSSDDDLGDNSDLDVSDEEV